MTGSGYSFDREKTLRHIAKLKKGGANFEISINFDEAIKYKQGKADIMDVLTVQKIFSDVKKGLVASETQMKQLFGTSEPLEVAKIIIENGELPLTADYKAKLREEKRKQIINLIHMNAVDPKTHLPHPPQRIENALVEAKVHIDDFKSAQDQLEEVVKQIRHILPIRFEIKEIAVKIPPQYAAKSYSVIKSFGKMLKDDWQNDGSLVAVIEIPGGLENDFYDKLNALCHGTVESKVINTK